MGSLMCSSQYEQSRDFSYGTMKTTVAMAVKMCVLLLPIATFASSRDQSHLHDGLVNVVRLRETKDSDSMHRSNRIAGDIFRGILEDEARPQCASMSLPLRPHKAKKTSAPSMFSEKPSTVPPKEEVTKPVIQLTSSPTKTPSTPPIMSSDTPSLSPEGLSAPENIQGKTNAPSSTTPSAATGSPTVLLEVPTFGSNDPSANPVVSSQPQFDHSSKPSKPPENQFTISSNPSVDQSSVPSQPSSNDSTMTPFLGSAIPSVRPNSPPTEVLISENGAFGCKSEESNGQIFQSVTFTGIAFNVSYQVESLAPLIEFLKDMEAKILEIALSGALQCNVGLLIASNITKSNTVITTTNFGGSCVPPVTSCLNLMTVFNATVNEELDPDVAAFLGYILLREEMDGGTFSKEIQLIDSMKYTGPLPLLPPVSNDDEVNQDPVQGIQASDRASVSPWALGAVSVACKSVLTGCPRQLLPTPILTKYNRFKLCEAFGGLVVLIAWLRRKATQNRRHMELIEDMSVGSPSHA